MDPAKRWSAARLLACEWLRVGEAETPAALAVSFGGHTVSFDPRSTDDPRTSGDAAAAAAVGGGDAGAAAAAEEGRLREALRGMMQHVARRRHHQRQPRLAFDPGGGDSRRGCATLPRIDDRMAMGNGYSPPPRGYRGEERHQAELHQAELLNLDFCLCLGACDGSCGTDARRLGNLDSSTAGLLDDLSFDCELDDDSLDF